MLLLDTASLYFRAFYGLPDSLKAPDGTVVNAVRGLLEFITRLTSEYDPAYLVCCWDNNWRPAWRVGLLPEYKAHRVSHQHPGGGDEEDMPAELRQQIPIMKQVLDAVGIAVVGVDDYEADDVVASLSVRAPEGVDIATGDRDLFQLVDDSAHVRVLYTARGVKAHEVITEAEVKQRFGIEAARYVDFAVLRGDPSDGIPGVRGIGDKTAAKLLNEYGDLQAILAAVDDPSTGLSPRQRENLNEARDYIHAAQQVVRVVDNLQISHDLQDLRRPRGFAHPNQVAELAQTFGLGGSVDRLEQALGA